MIRTHSCSYKISLCTVCLFVYPLKSHFFHSRCGLDCYMADCMPFLHISLSFSSRSSIFQAFLSFLTASFQFLIFWYMLVLERKKQPLIDVYLLKHSVFTYLCLNCSMVILFLPNNSVIAIMSLLTTICPFPVKLCVFNRSFRFSVKFTTSSE